MEHMIDPQFEYFAAMEGEAESNAEAGPSISELDITSAYDRIPNEAERHHFSALIDHEAGGSGGEEASYGEEGDDSRQKKRPREEPETPVIKLKKTRQSQSCDACRARKVKCDRPPPSAANIDPNLPTKDKCTHCIQISSPCTFDYKPKKRGPPNLYMRKLKDGEVSASPGSQDGRSDKSMLGALQDLHQLAAASERRTYPPNPNVQETSSPYVTNTSYWRSGQNPDDGGPGPGTLAEQRAMHATSLMHQGAGTAHHMGKDVEAEWEPHLLKVLNATSHLTPDGSSRPGTDFSHGKGSLVSPSSNHSGRQGNTVSDQQVGPHSQSPLYNLSPILHYPHDSNNPLDAVLPRGLLYHVIDLFFDYIYALIPGVHKPTFMRDLHEGREEQPEPEEFIALVMSIVAATLTQMPRSFVPLPRREVKELATKTCRLAREYLCKDFQTATSTRYVTAYLSALAMTMLGMPMVASELFGSVWALMIRNRCNEKEAQPEDDEIETQMKRRIFWLVYGGSVSSTINDSTTLMVHEEMCAETPFPAAVDDEYITANEILPQPEDKPSVLIGFIYISQLFKLTGQVLGRKMRDRRTPPKEVLLQMRLNEINELYDQVMSLMDDCPEPLRLDFDNDGRSASSFPDDWDVTASAELQQLFFNPKASKAAIKDAFLVQQGNIYVTQQMVRYMILQYRDELVMLQREEMASKPHAGLGSREKPRRQSSSVRKGEFDRALFTEEEKDSVASDLLSILQAIPIQVIAVNSMPLVMKVRFVASMLLDAIGPEVEMHSIPQGLSNRIRRAQSYLWDFLRVLSEIESFYGFDEDVVRNT